MLNFDPPNLKGAKTVIYDTETNGLDWTKNHVVGHVITIGPSPDETFYFPVRHGCGDNYDPNVVAKWIDAEVASRSDNTVVGHHLKFDLHMAANDGIFFKGGLECTSVNSSLLDENAGSYSLENCAIRFGVEEKKGHNLYSYLASKFGGHPDRKQMSNFWKLSAQDPMVNEYARGDGTTTYQLWLEQKKWLEKQELLTVWGVECKVIRTLFRMERRGVAVDLNRLDWLDDEISRRLRKLRNETKWLDGVNERSNPQMRELMIRLGHTDWPMTPPSKKFPEGQPSFAEAWLETFEDGKKILAVRKLTNLRNTFVEGAIRGHIHNGRIHTTYNQLAMGDYGTVTGRLSSSEPNMQQVPKRDKELAPLFRRVFVADDGMLWSSNDYKQQEFVVFAEYTRNPVLVAGYKQNPPIDMHQSVADMLGVERDPTAKRLNLGQVYGMGYVKLADKLHCSLAQAKKYNNDYNERIPEAKRFLKKAEKLAKARGYVKTFLGRRRRFPNPGLAHKAGNSVIQGGSADITKLKMVEVDEYFASRGDQCYLDLQVHDELDWQFPEGAEDQNAEAIRIMEDFGPGQKIEMDVPLRVDNDIATDWGKASFPKFDWGKIDG